MNWAFRKSAKFIPISLSTVSQFFLKYILHLIFVTYMSNYNICKPDNTEIVFVVIAHYYIAPLCIRLNKHSCIVFLRQILKYFWPHTKSSEGQKWRGKAAPQGFLVIC